MDTLILILLPLVISSLGFLTYRHPPIARQILRPLQYTALVSFVLLTIYNTTQSNAYYKALRTTYVDIYERHDIDLNIDSLYKSVKNQDSINLIVLGSRYQREKSYEIDKYQRELKDTVQKSIQGLLQKSEEAYYAYSLYCLIAFLIIVTLHGLTFLFDNIHYKEKISDINNTNDQAK